MSANVLVVDERPESQNVIESYLNDSTCNVYSVDDTAKGLQLFREKNINLIICNLLSPIAEGIDFIQQIKQKRPEASIVAVSESGKSEYFSMTNGSVADRFLHKPFTKSELIDTFNSIGYFINTRA